MPRCARGEIKAVVEGAVAPLIIHTLSDRIGMRAGKGAVNMNNFMQMCLTSAEIQRARFPGGRAASS